jgi:hypothetical protein
MALPTLSTIFSFIATIFSFMDLIGSNVVSMTDDSLIVIVPRSECKMPALTGLRESLLERV